MNGVESSDHRYKLESLHCLSIVLQTELACISLFDKGVGDKLVKQLGTATEEELIPILDCLLLFNNGHSLFIDSRVADTMEQMRLSRLRHLSEIDGMFDTCFALYSVFLLSCVHTSNTPPIWTSRST